MQGVAGETAKVKVGISQCGPCALSAKSVLARWWMQARASWVSLYSGSTVEATEAEVGASQGVLRCPMQRLPWWGSWNQGRNRSGVPGQDKPF